MKETKRKNIVFDDDASCKDDQSCHLHSKIIDDALRKYLPDIDSTTVTLKTLYQQLSQQLNIPVHEIKKWKEEIKKIVARLLHLCKDNQKKEDSIENNPRNGSIESNDSDQPQKSPKKKTKRKQHSPKASKQSKRKISIDKKQDLSIEPSPAIVALKEMSRACSILSPSLYRVLKEASSMKEQENILREKLFQAGIFFKSSYPSKSEILAAKKKREFEKDMEGIDSSLILESSSRTRRGNGLYTSHINLFDDVSKSNSENTCQEKDSFISNESGSECEF